MEDLGLLELRRLGPRRGLAKGTTAFLVIDLRNLPATAMQIKKPLKRNYGAGGGPEGLQPEALPGPSGYSDSG